MCVCSVSTIVSVRHFIGSPASTVKCKTLINTCVCVCTHFTHTLLTTTHITQCMADQEIFDAPKTIKYYSERNENA